MEIECLIRGGPEPKRNGCEKDLTLARPLALDAVEEWYLKREGEEAWGVEGVREARRKGWVDMWVDREEDFVGGGLMEVVRRFEVGTLD